MKFENFSKEHQEFLMYCLFDHIKSKVKKQESERAQSKAPLLGY